MRLKWFKNLPPVPQILILSGLIFVLLIIYIPLSKHIRPAITTLLFSPLKFCQDLSANARHFLRFQDLAEENKRLKKELRQQNGRLIQSRQSAQENQRLRSLLSLSKRSPYRMCAALIIGKDSSNWTQTAMINKGSSSGIKKGMAVISDSALVGKIIEVGLSVSKVSLISDFNARIPAKVLRSRQEGVVFGDSHAGENICKIKYAQDVKMKDKVVSSGLAGVYPKGLLIGEVVAVEDEKNRLYKIAKILPAAELSSLEEVMVITGQ